MTSPGITWIFSSIVMIRRPHASEGGQLVAKRGELRLTARAQFRGAEVDRLEARELRQELLENLESEARACLDLTNAFLGTPGSFDNSPREIPRSIRAFCNCA